MSEALNVTLHYDGRSLKPKEPMHGHHTYGVFGVACPECKTNPARVSGRKGTMTHDHDTYKSEAGCYDCQAPMGTITVKVATLFGIEEDEAVLMGRWRVY